jgi:hypothetical protein
MRGDTALRWDWPLLPSCVVRRGNEVSTRKTHMKRKTKAATPARLRPAKKQPLKSKKQALKKKTTKSLVGRVKNSAEIGAEIRRLLRKARASKVQQFNLKKYFEDKGVSFKPLPESARSSTPKKGLHQKHDSRLPIMSPRKAEAPKVVEPGPVALTLVINDTPVIQTGVMTREQADKRMEQWGKVYPKSCAVVS